jgi:hypothetical protein
MKLDFSNLLWAPAVASVMGSVFAEELNDNDEDTAADGAVKTHRPNAKTGECFCRDSGREVSSCLGLCQVIESKNTANLPQLNSKKKRQKIS